jgi:predicted hydrocarbon binding protein
MCWDEQEFSMVQEQALRIANSQLRLILTAAQQVIGENNLKEIVQAQDLSAALSPIPPDDLDMVFPARDYARLLAAIETAYGSRGSRILERIGRSTFHLLLREEPNWMSAAQRTTRLWKPARRIEILLEALIESRKKTYPQSEAWIEIKNGKINYVEQDCLACYERKSTTPICSLNVGFIGGATRWTAGTNYNFTETACMASGDPYCRFTITRSSAV